MSFTILNGKNPFTTYTLIMNFPEQLLIDNRTSSYKLSSDDDIGTIILTLYFIYILSYEFETLCIMFVTKLK